MTHGVVRGCCEIFAGNISGEINLLISAMKDQVPANLLSSKGSTPWELLLNRLTRLLHDNLGLTEEGASWAVESWALALGVISPAELIASKAKPAVDLTPPGEAVPAGEAPPCKFPEELASPPMAAKTQEGQLEVHQTPVIPDSVARVRFPSPWKWAAGQPGRRPQGIQDS